MSFGGMLATALAGGAQQVGQIAANDVQNQQRLDMAKEQAAIEEQMRMRLAEFQEGVRQKGALADVSGPLGDAKLAFKGKELDQNRAADVQKARDMIPVTTDAARAMIPVQREQAVSAADTAREVTKAGAADTAFLAAKKTIALADPEVAAKIMQMKAAANASNASAGASAAHAGLLRAQTVGVNLTNDDQQKLNDIYDGMSNVLTDPKLDEGDRAKKLNELQQRATLIQGRSGKNASPRDPELNTDTITTKTVDPKTLAETTVVSKRVRKPGDGGGEEKAPYPDGTELKGKDGKTYVVRNGQPVLKEAAAPARAAPKAAPPADDMAGITFSGDGYKFNGVTYPTPAEAKAARDKVRGSDNPMSKTLNRYGDD